MLSKFREPVSGLTHMAAALLSVLGLGCLLYTAVKYGDVWQIVSFSIFGVSMILLYSGSAVYHLVNANAQVVKMLRRVDHMLIFVLIAGTYTPFCLGPLRGPWGFGLLLGVWTFGILGMIFALLWVDAPRWLTTGIYLAMGWAVVVAGYPLVKSLSVPALVWLAVGGLFYSVGAVVYATKRPNLFPGVFGFHEIWHLFVMAGSFSHFWTVLRHIPTLS
ncbi:MAG: PAQR family membrane homeostasis protein TrhA [Bacillota bacterium]